MFITFEGPEGAGKTTIIHMIYNQLKEEGYDVILTREPGGIQIAEQIREIILNPANTAMDARTEALLYAAARRQHLVEKVVPALEEGKIILCDRFVDSSLAYQGFARGLGIDEIYQINQFAIDGLMPKATLFFDIKPEVGLERINRNKEREVNRLDLEKIEFHQHVRNGYLKVIEKFPNRMHSIDASRTIEEVYQESYKKLMVLLNK